MKEKICARHLDAIVVVIRKKGMWHLVAATKDESMARASRWLSGQTPPGEFDPLVIAMLEIYKKAADTFGMPDMCPLCAANKVYQKTDIDAAWIDNITDLMLVACLANDLMKPRGHKVTH